MDKLKGFFASIMGEQRLPKSFRKTLDKYKDATIQKIEINREPLSRVAEGLMSLITLGKWKDIRKNYDKIYHLYAVLYTNKGKLYLEKNQTPILAEGAPSRGKENETLTIEGDDIPVGEFIEKTIKRLGLATYISYDGFRYNCQHFIKSHLAANGLLSKEADDFVYQNTEELINNTPSFSQRIGQGITDIAGYADRAVQELVYKKGGKIGHVTHHKHKKFII